MHAPLAIKQPARWRVIVAGICALILTVGLARFAYTPMLPIMREQAGLTHWAAGWLATVNYAGYMAGTLLAASINDLGRKYLIYRCGLVIAVVSTAAMGWTDSVPVWSVLRFVAGFSSTAGLLLASGLVLNWLIRQGHRPQLLIRPCEVLSRVANVTILEVANNALRVLLQHRHVIIGSLA